MPWCLVSIGLGFEGFEGSCSERLKADSASNSQKMMFAEQGRWTLISICIQLWPDLHRIKQVSITGLKSFAPRSNVSSKHCIDPKDLYALKFCHMARECREPKGKSPASGSNSFSWDMWDLVVNHLASLCLYPPNKKLAIWTTSWFWSVLVWPYQTFGVWFGCFFKWNHCYFLKSPFLLAI
jgi:hypothetical protein